MPIDQPAAHTSELPSGKGCTRPLYDPLDNPFTVMCTTKGIPLVFGSFVDMPTPELLICQLQCILHHPLVTGWLVTGWWTNYIHIGSVGLLNCPVMCTSMGHWTQFLPIDSPLNRLGNGFNRSFSICIELLKCLVLDPLYNPLMGGSIGFQASADQWVSNHALHCPVQ